MKEEKKNHTIEELKQKLINYFYEISYYTENDIKLLEILLKKD